MFTYSKLNRAILKKFHFQNPHSKILDSAFEYLEHISNLSFLKLVRFCENHL